MDIAATKLELIDLLLQTEKDAVLQQIKKILLSQDNDFVSLSVLGKPLNHVAYNLKLQKSENDLINGNFISNENLKKKYKISNE